mgnify:CR=1 FL=1
MIDNGTTVKAKDNRTGKVIRKRRVPRSKPVAWQYEVGFSDGTRKWVKRLDVKEVKDASTETS